MKGRASHWVPIDLAGPGEPEPFDMDGVKFIMTYRFDDGVFFLRRDPQ